MNRMFQLAAAAAAAAGGFGSVGCVGDRPTAQDRLAGKVDPCWPERYNYTARQEVLAPFAAHVTNGTIIDQTLFNYHFEPGSEKLNPAGAEKLDYLARRRPAPDAKLYVQTARDVAYDPAHPDKLAAVRGDLDAKRAQAVHKYLAASNAGRNLAFEVQVTDPADLSISAQGPATSARGWQTRYQSGIGGGGGTLTGAGGGAAPGGGGAAAGGTPR